MPRPPPAKRDQLRESGRDFLRVAGRREKDVARPEGADAKRANWPPVPDLFDVITFFRERGDSFALIASIGFWVSDQPSKALTARGLKLWYESELERRAAARASIR